MALVPRGYGGFPPVQFGLSNQRNYRNYNSGYDRREAPFAPRYSAQPFYQPTFDSYGGYPSTGYDQMKRPGLGVQLANLIYQLDDQYRYEQYLRNLEKMQKNSWRQPAYTMPSPMYTSPLPPYDPNYSAPVIYNYEKEIEYIPYPIYIGPSGANYGAAPNLGNTTTSNFNFGIGGGANLLPKVRVIFIPPGNSSLQQSYTGPLAMPPFLFNRMSQPMCSFPVPPPLPQLGSLPLSPAIQQMVMQRYSNPVAVLPFSSNWQMPQQMMFDYPQAQQQQQCQQPMMPMSGCQPLPPAPPPYMPPPPPMLACQSFPPAPQSYIPPPMPAFQSLPPAPQPYVPPPMPTFQSFPPAQQPYYSLPPTIPNNMTMLPPPPPPPLQASLPDAYATPFVPQYSNSDYPSLCRACPPAPPPLSIPVTGHCWVQHCSACHHVPIPVSNSNARPSGGRITPLLRHPTVPQYAPNETIQQQQQYPHVNAPVMMRPWLRRTPPLPPGAIVISDEYINRHDAYPRHRSSRRHHKHHQRRSGHTKRSTTVTPTTTTTTITPVRKRNNRSVSPKRPNNNNNTIQRQGPMKSKSTTSTSSSSTSSGSTSVEYQKLTLNPSKSKKTIIPPQLASEARNINLQYNYQSQEVPSVYLINRYLKSSSEASSLFSNLEKSFDGSSPHLKKLSPFSSPSIDLHSIKEESTLGKENEKSSRSPSQIKQPKEKLIIIRELSIRSPSSISTISSNMSFSIIDKDSDSISTTSTIKAANLK